MNFYSLEDLVQVYLRALRDNRVGCTILGLLIAVVTLALAVTWPKSYTASATIYADNSNLLRPLMDGEAAVRANMVDQARMAQDILFSNEYADAILETAGYPIASLSPLEKDRLIDGIESATSITNDGRGNARLVRIAHTDRDPVKAFRIAQRYTTIFIEQAALSEQEDSRRAFEFIEAQVESYQQKLQESEARLSAFKSDNNFGTLSDANNKISGYSSDIEQIDLELAQIDRQIESLEAQLAGELQVSRDLSQLKSLTGRINALQLQLDNLRSRFHDTYPDVVQVKNQIADLQAMLESGEIVGYESITVTEMNSEGVTSLQQELRSRLSGLQVEREARLSQRGGITALRLAEQERARRINQTEAQLAELTRDYDVTQNFYNTMLERLENARVSMHLNEQQQGITFKIQESAAVPTQPDGLSFSQLMIASFLLSVSAPIGLMVATVQVDPRIRSEAAWSKDWPPLLVSVPPYREDAAWWRSGPSYVVLVGLLAVSLYGSVGFLYL